ncbi:metal ABC transporter ATP-binding protein [Bacillus sp. AGMB 02131]|uniref:Metal ABC transporter ATP-binding protein n=1 Tax=Peribacillus faecalis TaxID=2772559 RepID=A0A927HAM3_9BACI|nr:metal ABC transporter ATP-binding protein [Peribacillus faecalis]MBD3107601.1 metal ABC transporter ATP-binding protein [Peribacillus faecalis]
MNETVINIKDLSYRYEKEAVLEHININIPKGSFLAIIGPNGSGKSTLIKLMLGLLKVQTGSIELFGQPIQEFKDWDQIGYVSQKANSFNSGFPATVFEVVMSGLTKKIGLFHFAKKQHREQVMSALKSVDMLDFADRNIGELSGGQQQRVFIARALVSDPQLLILDEPTVGVDAANETQFYKIVEHLNKDLGITIILVTHDIEAVSDEVTQVACLNKHLHFHGNSHEYQQLSDVELSCFYDNSPRKR